MNEWRKIDKSPCRNILNNYRGLTLKELTLHHFYVSCDMNFLPKKEDLCTLCKEGEAMEENPMRD